MGQAFKVAPVGDMFQCQIDKVFRDLPNICGIADDILIEGYDTNHFRCIRVPFF